jgi:anti-sigma B factor antagonist
MRNTIIPSKIATFEPSGYVTAANVNQFKQALMTAVKSQDYSVFLVDMSRVEFLDSAGLMAVVSAFRHVQAMDKHFSLCSLAPSVRIIFELTQLDRVLEIFEDREAFNAALNPLVAI